MSLQTRVFSIVGTLSLIGVAVYFTLQTWYMFAPMKWRVFYYDVYPLKSVYTIGETLSFYAEYEVHYRSHLRYLDKLFCDTGDGEFTHMYERGKEDPDAPAVARTITRFAFPNLINEPATCYLDTDIILELPYGVERVQALNTRHYFKIVEKKDATVESKTN